MSSDVEVQSVALFPLHTVLFPEGPLALRVFEPRYLDLVSECLRNEQPFGVCLIQSGQEAGQAANPHLTGTFARIIDWQRGDDGLLSIKARGEQRFRVQDTRIERKTEVHDQLHTHAGDDYSALPKRPDDASWVGYRLAEILSLPLVRRQYFLELEDPLLRLSQLDEILRAMAESRDEE
jgi:hypothetical protein